MSDAQYIINEMNKLEVSGFKTIEHYMSNMHGIDWRDYEFLVKLADLLKKSMYRVENEYNGHTVYEWYSY